MKKKIISIVSIALTVILLVVSCLLLYQRVVFFNAIVVGSSMETTLHEGQICAVKKAKYVSSFSRGDIIVFNRDTGSTDEYEVIKRIIGLPGDKIKLEDNKVYINDNIYEESYLTDENHLNITNKGTYSNFNYVLGDDEYYVMGDNRKNSYDSRYYGPINKSDIVGRLTLVYAEGECVNSCDEIKNKKSIPWIFF